MKNKDKLLSPFDIHATIRDLTCLKNSVSNENEHRKYKRSISLLDDIPSERTCNDIGISQHFCSCVKWINMDIENELSQLASIHTIDYINSLTKPFKNCALQTLKKIYSVSFLLVDNQFKFRIKILTAPNDAIYEAQLQFSHSLFPFFDNKKFSIDSPNHISRLNRYGSQAICTEKFDSPIDLRKFCYCI